MIKWVVKATVSGLIVGFIFVVAFFAVSFVKKSPLFTINIIEVHGVSHVDIKKLQVAYKHYLGKNIFTEIRTNKVISEDPWILRVETRRILPNKLDIIVTEEREMIALKKGNECFSLTQSGSKIKISCENVNVFASGNATDKEIKIFSNMYSNNEWLKDSQVVLSGGLFTAMRDNATFTGTYSPEVFEENMKSFQDSIKGRYKKINTVDLTVRGKIYVKGVLHG